MIRLYIRIKTNSWERRFNGSQLNSICLKKRPRYVTELGDYQSREVCEREFGRNAYCWFANQRFIRENYFSSGTYIKLHIQRI